MLKPVISAVCLTIFAITLCYADVKIAALNGDVYIRRGVQENWVRAAVGDVLRQEDSIELGKKSSATLFIEGKTEVEIPQMVILDISDLRDLPQKELLLGLAKEQVLSVSPKERGDRFIVPRTTTIHGTDMKSFSSSGKNRPEIGTMRVNGASVLYKNGFYGTCVLKTKEILRYHPELMNMAEIRLMVADALESLNLGDEALDEYESIPSDRIPSAQRPAVESKIRRLNAERQKRLTK